MDPLSDSDAPSHAQRRKRTRPVALSDDEDSIQPSQESQDADDAPRQRRRPEQQLDDLPTIDDDEDDAPPPVVIASAYETPDELEQALNDYHSFKTQMLTSTSPSTAFTRTAFSAHMTTISRLCAQLDAVNEFIGTMVCGVKDLDELPDDAVIRSSFAAQMRFVGMIMDVAVSINFEMACNVARPVQAVFYTKSSQAFVVWTAINSFGNGPMHSNLVDYIVMSTARSRRLLAPPSASDALGDGGATGAGRKTLLQEHLDNSFDEKGNLKKVHPAITFRMSVLKVFRQNGFCKSGRNIVEPLWVNGKFMHTFKIKSTIEQAILDSFHCNLRPELMVQAYAVGMPKAAENLAKMLETQDEPDMLPKIVQHRSVWSFRDIVFCSRKFACADIGSSLGAINLGPHDSAVKFIDLPAKLYVAMAMGTFTLYNYLYNRRQLFLLGYVYPTYKKPNVSEGMVKPPAVGSRRPRVTHAEMLEFPCEEDGRHDTDADDDDDDRSVYGDECVPGDEVDPFEDEPDDWGEAPARMNMTGRVKSLGMHWPDDAHLGPGALRPPYCLVDIPTPCLDRVILTQISPDPDLIHHPRQLNLSQLMDYIWLKGLLGRMFFENGYDNWGVALLLAGIAGAGKSLIANHLKNCFEAANVSMMPDNIESVFGFSFVTKSGKLIIIAPEVTQKMTLPMSTFLAHITRDPITAAVKNGDPVSTDGDQPMLLVGNKLPSKWIDTGGQMTRRIAVFNFAKTMVGNANTRIPELLKLEQAAFIVKAAAAYKLIVRHVGHRDIHAPGVLPKRFTDSMAKARLQLNPLVGFFMSDIIEHTGSEDDHILHRDLHSAIRHYNTANGHTDATMATSQEIEIAIAIVRSEYKSSSSLVSHLPMVTQIDGRDAVVGIKWPNRSASSTYVC